MFFQADYTFCFFVSEMVVIWMHSIQAKCDSAAMSTSNFDVVRRVVVNGRLSSLNLVAA